MKLLLLAFMIAGPILAGAQQVSPAEQTSMLLYADVRGINLPARKERNTEGSPFLMPDYCNANIKVQNGKRYEDVPVKVNLQDNAIYFKFGDQKEMIATVPIEYIEFTGCSTDGKLKMVRSGFPSVDKNTAATYYEVLSDGPVKLLKHFIINYQEQTPYNSTAVLRIYNQVPEYYAYSGKAGMVKLKDSETALVVLSEHKEQAIKFISEQNIKIKKENDLVKLITYYNAL